MRGLRTPLFLLNFLLPKKSTFPTLNIAFDEIYETIYGEVLSDEKAKRLVCDMKPYGEHWTMEQVEQAINDREWKLSTRYYTLNMMYNDYHKLFQEDTNKYVELALMWLEDEDSDGGDIKTYRYAVYV